MAHDYIMRPSAGHGYLAYAVKSSETTGWWSAAHPESGRVVNQLHVQQIHNKKWVLSYASCYDSAPRQCDIYSPEFDTVEACVAYAYMAEALLQKE